MKQYLGLNLSYESFVKTPKQGHSCFEANRGTCLSLKVLKLKEESKYQRKEFNHGHSHSCTGYGPATSYVAQLRDSLDSLIRRIISL